MKASELVGKRAIRTKPVDLGNGSKDYSYTTSPIEIVKVTDNHIVHKYKMFGEEHVSILGERWMDNNWIDYNELIGF